MSKLQLWRGAGCPACKHTGYKGRMGIYELMILDERFHDPILHRAGAPEYLRLAQEKGMRTMFEDGVLKAMQGVTTMEELLRVTGWRRNKGRQNQNAECRSPTSERRSVSSMRKTSASCILHSSFCILPSSF